MLRALMRRKARGSEPRRDLRRGLLSKFFPSYGARRKRHQRARIRRLSASIPVQMDKVRLDEKASLEFLAQVSIQIPRLSLWCAELSIFKHQDSNLHIGRRRDQRIASIGRQQAGVLMVSTERGGRGGRSHHNHQTIDGNKRGYLLPLIVPVDLVLIHLHLLINCIRHTNLLRANQAWR